MTTAPPATGSRPLSDRTAPRVASGARNSSSEATRGPAAALAERIKELNRLYGISNLFETEGVSLPWIMQRAVDLIPAAWQYPENACARIDIDGQVYVTADFRPTARKRTGDIVVNGETVGSVCVCYLASPPGAPEPVFLEEEQRLLTAIGERPGKVWWLKRAEEALKAQQMAAERRTDSLGRENRVLRSSLGNVVRSAPSSLTATGAGHGASVWRMGS